MLKIDQNADHCYNIHAPSLGISFEDTVSLSGRILGHDISSFLSNKKGFALCEALIGFSDTYSMPRLSKLLTAVEYKDGYDCYPYPGVICLRWFCCYFHIMSFCYLLFLPGRVTILWSTYRIYSMFWCRMFPR